ncbi:2-amino-4-hydroxy-6-hydroxymethyldihydropteridine diphosphokinase [Hydromonas duriensis]|uniref:2-amino-4-hydroxy-6-hydroxymethyldihydropteridine pyrophosphokinase n=1 Tax=Hydromonas duriensis TaxID=1527608 RepID=A0A4R6YAY1_9BURK|nr:2-amino-4-hydroxy-6-hydroxymethyldihydropteridine diphosphokinase [Hydromonas duriensis]TDR32761.1 2-amino-4-hydroxy-6-hydroxymethyldihydropteridine diphosphokinase [Hydromonas duriensis]
MNKVRAYIGLGANLGEPTQTVRVAIHALGQLHDTQVLAVSSLYGSAPVGDGADGPNYINAVVQLETELTAHELLDELQQIESEHGRERSYRNAPRTLDMDILLYGNACLHDERLTVPHPRMCERGFVLLPLAEIASELTWLAADGKIQVLSQLLPLVNGQDVSRLTNHNPNFI